jgi:hypothetical protein
MSIMSLVLWVCVVLKNELNLFHWLVMMFISKCPWKLEYHTYSLMYMTCFFWDCCSFCTMLMYLIRKIYLKYCWIYLLFWKWKYRYSKYLHNLHHSKLTLLVTSLNHWYFWLLIIVHYGKVNVSLSELTVLCLVIKVTI